MTEPKPGLTPLSIILDEMHRKWAQGDKAGAVELARLAAPYMHGRATAAKPHSELSKLSDADLDQLFGTGGAAAPDTGPA